MIQAEDRKTIDLFAAGARWLQMTESIELTIQSLQAYGHEYDQWGIAWSGGKDSSTTLSLNLYLLDSGKIPNPKTLAVFYAKSVAFGLK